MTEGVPRVTALLVLALAISTISPVVADGTNTTETEGPTPDDVIQAMADETTYRTNFTAEISTGDKQLLIDGWMDSNVTTGNSHGTVVASGTRSLDAEFYITEGRYYFKRSQDDEWYWRDRDGAPVPSHATREEILADGILLSADRNPTANTTTFTIKPTSTQATQWISDAPDGLSISRIRYEITVADDTHRIREASTIIRGTADGTAFSATATAELSRYGDAGEISPPPEVRNATQYNWMRGMAETSRDMIEFALIAILVLMVVLAILAPLMPVA